MFQITRPLMAISMTLQSTLANTVPNTPQGVEFLLESITSQDNSIQAAMGNIRANANGPRSDFEGYLLTSKIKTVVLNKTVALTCIFLFYVCNLHAYQYLHFDKILSTFLTDSLCINKGCYIKEGRETSMSIVMNDQYQSWLNRRHVYETILQFASVPRITYEGITKLPVLCGIRIAIV